MSTSLLEIVDLGDGEVVLQRVEGDSEPLVSIQFSDEANAYLMGNNLEIAKVMIQAGIEAAAQVYYGRHLWELTLAEQAMMAGLYKAPSRYNPISNPEKAIKRRNYVSDARRKFLFDF